MVSYGITKFHSAQIQQPRGILPNRFTNMDEEFSGIIVGPTCLKAPTADVTIPDLRTGFAIIIAASLAEGTTTIRDINKIERGYSNLVPKLERLDLQIEKKWSESFGLSLC